MTADVGRRVAVVVPSLARAGAERVAETLAGEFARTVEVTIVTMEPRLSARQLEDLTVLPWADRIPDGCRHVHLPSSGSGLVRLLPLVVRLALLARRARFEAVYSFLTWTNVLVAVARLLGGRYVHVASEHALAASLRNDEGQLKTIARTLPLVYRLPDWIVVVSDAARESLRSGGLLPRGERAVTIANPVDAAEIRRLADEPLNLALPTGRMLIVCVARLHPQKDHDTLLRALTRLPERYVAVLVGDGSHREVLARTVADLGLADRVTFTGVLPNPYPVMRCADVVVLPSREEGFGLVAAEAAALSVPFVGSEVGGLGELCSLLGHRTFTPGDDAALAAAIIDATTNGRTDAGTSALVDRLFDPQTVAHAYLQLADHGHGRARAPDR